MVSPNKSNRQHPTPFGGLTTADLVVKQLQQRSVRVDDNKVRPSVSVVIKHGKRACIAIVIQARNARDVCKLRALAAEKEMTPFVSTERAREKAGPSPQVIQQRWAEER